MVAAGRRWRKVIDIQADVDGVLESEWFGQRWPHLLRCAIERRSSGARWSTFQGLDADGPDGRATEGVLLIAPAGLDQLTVLHELAHLVLPPGVGHCVEFAETLLAMVRHEMGFFAYAELRQALRSTAPFANVEDQTVAG